MIHVTPSVVSAEPGPNGDTIARWFVESSKGDGRYYAVTLGADGAQSCSCHYGRLVAMRVELGHEPGKPCRHLAAVEAHLLALAVAS